MIFRATLEHSLRDRSALRFAAPPPLLNDVAALLVGRHGDGTTLRKSPDERAALLERLRLARFDWNKIRTSDRYEAAWVLWDGPEPPAENKNFLAALLAWAETPWRATQACRIAASWADAFDPGLGSIQIVAEWLAAHAAELVAPWPLLAKEFAIFSLEKAPINLARLLLAGMETEQTCFDRLGLADRTEASGLRLAALGAVADILAPRLAERPALATRLIELSLRQPGLAPGGNARARHSIAKSIRVKLAETLLLPWRHEDPPQRVKDQIVNYLLRHCEDPRVDDAIWGDVEPLATNIMRDWLKAKTIAAFFRLADRKKGDHRAQAGMREGFWMSYLDRIDDAWLVAETQSVATLGTTKLGYGRMIGSRPGDCALLLRIGGMTIVETSHSASEHVWLAGNRLAPPLYQERDNSYHLAILTSGADFSSGYSCSSGRDWRERLNEFIAKHSRIAA